MLGTWPVDTTILPFLLHWFWNINSERFYYDPELNFRLIVFHPYALPLNRSPVLWVNVDGFFKISSRPTVFWHELHGKMGHVGKRKRIAETQKGLCDTFTCSPELFSHGPQQPPAWPDRHPRRWRTHKHTCTHTHNHSHPSTDLN